MNNSNLTQRHIAHFGAITFNYAMAGFIICLACVLSVLVSFLFLLTGFTLLLLYYVALIAITVVTAFTLLLAEEYRMLFNPEIVSKLGDMSDWMMEMSPKLLGVVPNIALVTGILSIISFVCLLFDRKWEKSKFRLFTLGVIVVSLITLVILILVGIISAKGA